MISAFIFLKVSYRVDLHFRFHLNNEFTLFIAPALARRRGLPNDAVTEFPVTIFCCLFL